MNSHHNNSHSTGRTARLALLFASTLLSASVSAMPMTFFGADAGNSNTTNTDIAFTNWSVSVGNNFTLDNFDNPTGTPGFGGTLTTSLGNTFSTTDDLLGNSTFGVGAIQGSNLQLTKQGPEMDFIWDIVAPANAFGFFSRNNSGGIVNILFDDGNSQDFAVQALDAGNGDNLFWGVSGLAAAVQQVTITSTDPRNNANWDRFVYQTATVPEPGMLLLLGFGLAGIVFSRHLEAGRTS